MNNSLSRPWQSRTPDVIDALVSLFTAAFSTTKVQVHDGPWTSMESSDQAVVVGWFGFPPTYEYPTRAMNEDEGLAAASVETVMEGLGPSLREKITVNCASLARQGSGKGGDARRAVYANLAIVGSAVTANPTLSGASIQTVLGVTSQLHQVKDRRGALAIVTFGVECEAYAQQ